MYHKYQIPVLPVNCEQLKKEDITMILEQVLMEFPLVEIRYQIPGWVEMLPCEHPVNQEVIEKIRSLMDGFQVLRDVGKSMPECESTCISRIKLEQILPDCGMAVYSVEMKESS